MKFNLIFKVSIRRIVSLAIMCVTILATEIFLIVNKIGFNLEVIIAEALPIFIGAVALYLFLGLMKKRSLNYYLEISDKKIEIHGNAFVSLVIDDSSKLTVTKDEDHIVNLLVETNERKTNLKNYEKLDKILELILPFFNPDNVEYLDSKNSKKNYLSFLIYPYAVLFGFGFTFARYFYSDNFIIILMALLLPPIILIKKPFSKIFGKDEKYDYIFTFIFIISSVLVLVLDFFVD